ncbi:MAG TPA: ABC transporter permease subunit [Acidimicrobiales bacterium]|nr:ABC transporter permease subunit [Acidimicrobiales bacterium]
MATEAALAPPPAAVGPTPAGGHPELAVARLTARRVVRAAALWGYVFGLYVAVSAFAYSSTYKTAAQRHQLVVSIGFNTGISAILGPAHHIGTVHGFVAWRATMILSLVGGVWGLLTATRLLRGEEDAGRWEVLLAGQTTRRRATAYAVVGFAAGWAVLYVLTALITTVVGRSSKALITPDEALYLALALTASAAMFLAFGTLTSQLAPTRRQAASYAGAVLGLAYLLRMVADSGTGLLWLRWVSPLGWVEQLQPLTSPRPLAFLPIAAFTLGCVLLAVHLAGRRDLGASTVPDRTEAPARTRLLNGPTGATLRLTRPSILGWGVAVAVTGLMLGLIAKAGGEAVGASKTAEQVIARLGLRGTGAVLYLGLSFVIVAALAALMAAGQASAAREEEASERLEPFLSRAVSRWRWIGGRAGVAVASLVVAGVVGGLFSWFGATGEGAGVALPKLLEAGVNAVPPAVFVLGAGLLAFGILPRATSVVVYGIVGWSFLVEFVGGAANLNHWLLDTSLFHQMAAAPAVQPDWTVDLVLAGLGVAMAALGAVAFHRRDLAGA